MKYFSLLMLSALLFCFCACGNTQEDTTNLSESVSVSQIYDGSEYLGKWYNADTAEETLVMELKADGSAIYQGTHKGVWEETTDGISIKVNVDKKETVMTGYFVISGEGFVARATDENMHYLDEGKGELQLEIMLTEKTCVDCVKKG